MALKIRLRQQGRNNLQTYRLVLADERSPRDGKYIEMLGWYNPVLKENNITVNEERIMYWLSKGAKLTENVLCLIAKTAPNIAHEVKAKEFAKRKAAAAKRRNAKKSA